MAVLKHLHTYERSKDNMEIYRCIHPQCSHFNRRAFIVGKEVMCHSCHEPTIARNEQLHAGWDKIGTKKITCIKCSNSPKRFEIMAIDDILKEAMKDVILNEDTKKEEEPKSA